MTGGEVATAMRGEAAGERKFAGLSARGLLVASTLLITFVAMFWRWFEVQHKLSWKHKEDWGHAYLIPLISVWLLWRNRERLRAASKSVCLMGLAPLLFGVVGYVYWVIGGVTNHMLQGFCGVIAVFGLVLLLFGPAVSRASFLPVAYLSFGVTISTRIMDEITFGLKLLASEGSYVMLTALGAAFSFDVLLEGNTLTIEQVVNGERLAHPLNVAEACSGMRMVIAFYALAGAVALAACRQWWQRIATLLLAGPVAIFMNMVRVTVLGLLTLFDPDLAAGEAHTLIGTILLVPSLLLFLGIVWALNKIVRDDEPEQAAGVAGSSSAAWWGPRFTAAWVGSLAVLLVGAAWFSWVISAQGIALQKVAIEAPGNRQVSAIPAETPNWVQVGTDRRESAEIVEELGTENYLSRRYMRKTPDERGRKPEVELHLAYYTGMIETVPHVPERCFVAGGMQKSSLQVVVDVPMDASGWIVDRSAPESSGGEDGRVYLAPTDRQYGDSLGQRFRLPRDVGPDEPFRMAVSEFSANRGRSRLFAGYFFLANGGTVARAEGVRLLAFDRSSTYAYFMKVQVTTQAAESAEDFAAISGDLLGELIGEIMRCVPDWVEVEAGRYPPRGEGEKGSGGVVRARAATEGRAFASARGG